MNNIILQIAKQFMQEIANASENLTEVGLGQTTDDMKRICINYAGRFTEVAIAKASDTLDAAKEERKSDGIVIHEKNVKRGQYTSLGQIEYARTYYKDKNSGEMIYLLDHMIDVDKHERVNAHVSARLVSEAVSVSYAKSSRIVTEGELSRQTVKNKLMKTCELAHVPSPSSFTPEELHIFADEDHVPMQNGKNNNLNLITISEGTRTVSKGRKELVEPIHVQGYKIKPEVHWEYVSALCHEKYDMNTVKRIYIHGDGAKWIMKGTEHFTNAVHVLDGYHLNSSMKKLTCGEVCRNYSNSIWSALKSGDRIKFGNLVMDMMDDMERVNIENIMTKKIKTVREVGKYILSNWYAIQRRLTGNLPGSCTEPIISHVLSSRISRNPMGWSERGLSKMAMTRVFVKNGERIKAEHINSCQACSSAKPSREIKNYKEIVDKQQKEFLEEEWDLSIFDKPSYSMGLVTGTKRAYDAWAKTRYVN